MKEGFRPNQTVQPEAKPQGGPERPTLPQKSALNRAVERTCDLHKRNGWTFLPFSEAGDVSPALPSRPLMGVFSTPSHDILLEEPKKLAKNKSHHEELPKVPRPHNKTERRQLGPLARAMKEATRCEGVDPQALLQRSTEKIRSMLPDQDPDVAEVFRRTFGPPEHQTPSAEDLLRMFDLPSPLDESTNDDKR